MNYNIYSRDCLEAREWEKSSWHATSDKSTFRVLVVGDEVTFDIVEQANKTSNVNIIFDVFASSKALDNSCIRNSIVNFIHQQPNTDMIIISAGMHGAHLSEEKFLFYYKDTLRFLYCNFPNIPLVVATVTSVAEAQLDKLIASRNESTLKLAKQLDIPIIDLYNISCENKALLSENGVNFSEKGISALSEAFVKRASEISKG